MYRLVILLTLIFISFSNSAHSELLRGMGILDMTERNGEAHRANVYSVEYIAQTAGVAYVVTASLDEVLKYSIVIAAAQIKQSSFTDLEEEKILSYTHAGGVFIATNIKEDKLNSLFGVSAYTPLKTRYQIHWDTDLDDPALYWIDDPLEQTISLGNKNKGEIFTTYSYTPSTALVLATFDDDEAAILSHHYGQGYAYAIGFEFKQLILRNQINGDFNAHRSYSNGFEPTSDVIVLFIRGLYLKHTDNAVWKHTSPFDSTATVIVTHDVDSRTGYETIMSFADREYLRGIKATYNLSVNDFGDQRSSAYYKESYIPNIKYLMAQGHVIANHSYGHFPDFGAADTFPKGIQGVQAKDYKPYYENGVTTGGTVYGEVEVAHQLLFRDLGVEPRIWRSGHLLYPRDLPAILEENGYQYSSTWSANDVLSNFPFYLHANHKFQGELLNVIEIPMTLSDVFKGDSISEKNYPEKVAIWHDVTQRNAANNAPTVLLIHPNRDWKVTAEEHYLDGLSSDIYIAEMGEFGDYWRDREHLTYNVEVTAGQMIITLPTTALPANKRLSLIVESAGLEKIIVQNTKGQEQAVSITDFNPALNLKLVQLRKTEQAAQCAHYDSKNGTLHLPCVQSMMGTVSADFSLRPINQAIGFDLNLDSLQTEELTPNQSCAAYINQALRLNCVKIDAGEPIWAELIQAPNLLWFELSRYGFH